MATSEEKIIFTNDASFTIATYKNKFWMSKDHSLKVETTI